MPAALDRALNKSAPHILGGSVFIFFPPPSLFLLRTPPFPLLL